MFASGLRLEVSQTATINVQLAVGGVTEEVTVAADSPLLETSKADRGTVIDSARIAELPLQSRSPMALDGPRRRRQLQRAGDLPAAVRQRRARRLVDERRPEPQQRVPARRRAEQREPGRQQHRLRAAGRRGAGVQDPDELVRRAVRPHGRRRREHVAQVGDQLASTAPATSTTAASGSTRTRSCSTRAPRRRCEHYLDQYGFEVDGPVQIPGLYNGKNKTFFMFNGEKYREGTPAAQFSTVPTPAMKNGDFSGLVDAQGRLIIDLRSGHRARRERRLDARCRSPATAFRPTGSTRPPRKCLQYFPDPNCTTPGAARLAARTSATTSTSTRTCSGTGSARSTTTSAATTACSSAGARTSATKCGTRPPSARGPAQNGQLPLLRANDAFVGDWVHILGGGTVFNVRSSYTYYLEGSRSDYAFGFDSTQLGWPASLVSQLPAAQVGGLFPVVTMDQFVQLSRGFGPNTNKIYTVQPNISLDARQSQRPQRSRHARAPTSTTTNYGNAGGQIDFTRRVHPQHAEQHQQSRRQRVRVVPARRAVGRQRAGEPVPALHWTFVAPWVQDDWRVSSKLTLNLGFRWDFNSPVHEVAGPSQLRVRPDDGQPDLGAASGSTVLGGIRVRRRQRRSEHALEVRLEQLAAPRRRRRTRSTRRRCCAPATASTS